MMKLSPIALLAVIYAADPANALCNALLRYEGDGSEPLNDGGTKGSFRVDANAVTKCVVRCKSGSNVQLTIQYGSEPAIGGLGATTGLPFDCTDSGVLDTNEDGVVELENDGEREDTLGFKITASDYTDLRVDCSCTQTYSAVGGFSFCFSKDATAEVEGTGPVAMEDLQVGDRVLTGSGKYQPIYSFGHYSEDRAADFLQIYTQGNKQPLEMSGNHLLFKEGEAVRADSVKVGDVLSNGQVTKIGSQFKQGLYMPLTEEGTIVVNGVVASSYVSITEEAPSAVKTSKAFLGNEQNLLHWWLSPYRMMCLGVSSSFCNGSFTEQGILNYLNMGQELAKFADNQPSFVQYLMGLPLVFVFAVINLLEMLFGASYAPTALLMAGAGLAYQMRKKHVEQEGFAPVKKTV
jgi:hypothetical protein